MASAEPPLIRDATWTRTHMTSSELISEGFLLKVGARFKGLKQRWYMIKDNFLYCFHRRKDVKPAHIIFLDGCFIEAVSWGSPEETHASNKRKQVKGSHGGQLKWGFEVIMSEEPRKARAFYCKSAQERDLWIASLRLAANVHNVAAYYDIGEELGVGRFSSVCAGVSRTTGKQYAIKIIDKSGLSKDEREAMRTEIAVLKLVRHPHIIQLKNVFENRRQIHIVMNFVSGGDLFDRIRKCKRMSEAVAGPLIRKLLEAVRYLHERGIVHRDLKPENILLRGPQDDTDIVITDFGLSKFATPSEMMQLACGTLAYVAPEVLRMQGYGKEVDLWSVGVVMYFILRGQLPFDADTKDEIVMKTIEGELPLHSPECANISAEAKDLLRRLLQTDPAARATAESALCHPWVRTGLSPEKAQGPTRARARTDGDLPTQRETLGPGATHHRPGSTDCMCISPLQREAGRVHGCDNSSLGKMGNAKPLQAPAGHGHRCNQR